MRPRDNEHWLLTGPAGSGKTNFGRSLCREQGGLFIEQWYHFTDRTGLSDFYYQQRYNSQDSEGTATVADEVGGLDYRILEALHLEHRLHAPLIQLSSGEHKKLQLAKAFLARPHLLVLDNPYVGLDEASALGLDNLFSELAEQCTQLVIISDAHPIPECVTHVAILDNALQVVPRDAYVPAPVDAPPAAPLPFPGNDDEARRPLPGGARAMEFSFREAVRMDAVTVIYDDNRILDGVDWTVRKGERWLLRGPNGAGKSTLLSLIVGDNPQAYANKLVLFDRRRGSGESIWDIKRKIGYISPELHWYFDRNTTCLNAVVSGFFDTTGLYRNGNAAQLERAGRWLDAFGLAGTCDKRLSELSVGQQRMVLLARALVKDPPVLVLDEPCQGLDEAQTKRFLSLVDQVMEDVERTLIFVSHRKDQQPSCIQYMLTLAGGRITERAESPDRVASPTRTLINQ